MAMPEPEPEPEPELLSVAAAVALARSAGDSGAEPGSGAEPPRVVRVAEHVSVAGQVIARRRASKKLFFLDLRPHPAAAAEAGVFLQVLVKESGVGPATMEWARQGPTQLRPGDVLRCSGVLEYDRQAERQSQGAVLVAQGEGALRVNLSMRKFSLWRLHLRWSKRHMNSEEMEVA